MLSKNVNLDSRFLFFFASKQAEILRRQQRIFVCQNGEHQSYRVYICVCLHLSLRLRSNILYCLYVCVYFCVRQHFSPMLVFAKVKPLFHRRHEHTFSFFQPRFCHFFLLVDLTRNVDKVSSECANKSRKKLAHKKKNGAYL